MPLDPDFQRGLEQEAAGIPWDEPVEEVGVKLMMHPRFNSYSGNRSLLILHAPTSPGLVDWLLDALTEAVSGEMTGFSLILERHDGAWRWVITRFGVPVFGATPGEAAARALLMLWGDP